MKNRPPIEQLREAGRIAKEMLKQKGIIGATLEEIVKDANAPILPGIPSYLPHKWTIAKAGMGMGEILREWLAACGRNKKRFSNCTLFFKFAVKYSEKKVKLKKMEKIMMGMSLKELDDVPVLSQIMKPMQDFQVMKALLKFYIDSFAVSVMVQQNASTEEYYEWFYDWLGALYKLWEKKENADAQKKEKEDSTEV
jgi:hypothetical protein